MEVEAKTGKALCVRANASHDISELPPRYGNNSTPGRVAKKLIDMACEGEPDMKYTKEWLAEHPDVRPDPESWRALYTVEYERLQTLPEGYTDCLSRREAVNCIGDGWTVKVIEYLLSALCDESTEPVSTMPMTNGRRLSLFETERSDG